MPAFAARRAREPLDTPRACAVPSRESVIETPVKPRSSRSSVVAMAFDHPAALAASYAEYVAFDSMINGMSMADGRPVGEQAGGQGSLRRVDRHDV